MNDITQSEKKTTTITPDLLLQIAENKLIPFTKEQAEELIDENREYFKGSTLKGSEIVALIELKADPNRFQKLDQKIRDRNEDYTLREKVHAGLGS